MTINHEAVVGLGMDAMTTMVRLADPEMIEGLNVGDAIEFAADRDGARWTSQGPMRLTGRIAVARTHCPFPHRREASR